MFSCSVAAETTQDNGYNGKQSWHSGDSTRLPPMCPGLDSWIGLSLLVFSSSLRGFSTGTPVFPSLQKPTFDLI